MKKKQKPRFPRPYIPTDEKRKRNRRVVCALLCFLLTVSVLALPAAALTPDPSVTSASFRNSRYYLNLKALTFTGDERTDIVMVAMSQLGYHEGDWTSQFHGENKTGSDNYVEYNYFNGKVDQLGNGTLTYSYPWCASFVSFCARMAGIPTATLRSSLSCSQWVSYFREEGKFKTRQSGYTPRKGDLIFFRSSGSSSSATHVGIVRYTCNGIVYTVEGNSADQVRLS
ncbi:MAG: CHAP domain-containing protein, partial [Clostridia bacterium]|nr:CHAP domain-containing protein [Clostridia bacterium]